MRVLSRSLMLASLVAACSAGESAGPTPEPTVLSLAFTSGENQRAPVGTELLVPITVTVTNLVNADPVAGQLVNFVVTAGNGRMFAGSGITNDLGQVTDRWTLGTVAGVQTVEARAIDPNTGDPLVFGSMSAVADPGPLAVAEFTETLIHVLADSELVLPVKAEDAYGNPVPAPAIAALDGVGSLSGERFTASGLGLSRFVLGSDTLSVIVSLPAGHFVATYQFGGSTYREEGDLIAQPRSASQVSCSGGTLDSLGTVYKAINLRVEKDGVPLVWTTEIERYVCQQSFLNPAQLLAFEKAIWYPGSASSAYMEAVSAKAGEYTLSIMGDASATFVVTP